MSHCCISVWFGYEQVLYQCWFGYEPVLYQCLVSYEPVLYQCLVSYEPVLYQCWFGYEPVLYQCLVSYEPVLYQCLVSYEPVLYQCLVSYEPVLYQCLVSYEPVLYQCLVSYEPVFAKNTDRQHKYNSIEKNYRIEELLSNRFIKFRICKYYSLLDNDLKYRRLAGHSDPTKWMKNDRAGLFSPVSTRRSYIRLAAPMINKTQSLES
ncbi:hypothetical protein BgiMline_004275 [Biomphalaria glabrata]